MSNHSPVITRRADVDPRPRVFTVWERIRKKNEVHWIMECFAEFLGVFFYVWFGVGSTAPWVFGNTIEAVGVSSLLQIGVAYAVGISFAITVCSTTSGGHFNPCMTIAFTLFKGFPKLKAVRYIIAQILGAYVASVLVYYQWRPLIQEAEALLLKAGKYDALMFTPSGPAGIFALYLPTGQTMGTAFLNEFVNCVVLAIIVWSALDPTNYLLPPFVLPWSIGVAYAGAIWGFAAPGIALNSARDLGARFFAISIWGTKAWGGNYAALSALTNIPATLFGIALYEIFLSDSSRVIPKNSLEVLQIMHEQKRDVPAHATEPFSRSSDEKIETSYSA